MKYIRKTSRDITQDFSRSLLIDRGILKEDENTDWYFKPTYENLLDPLGLDHMEKGAELLLKHLKKGSHIRVYVDCDVDGFTSAALFINYYNKYLKNAFPDVTISYHIPDGKEHGLRSVMDELVNNKICDLIVLPDSSSNDYPEHAELRAMGYDILVLDHHDADHYSDNAVVINNQLSKDYKNKALSGVGVVYKFINFFDAYCWNDSPESKEEEAFKDFIYDDFLDLVALGEISDMMNMNTPENRYICDTGLSHIQNTLFRAIVKKQCYSMFGIYEADWKDSYYTSGDITQIKVAFYVTPLINALIRVGSQTEKEQLFLGFIDGDKVIPSTKRGAKGEMETVAEQVTRNCVNARSRQNREKDKAIELLDIQISNNCLDENKILILNADELSVSNNLTGLIAMGIAAKYKKPTMLGRISPDGYLKGSIRGREESELKDFKSFLKGSDYMDFVEGHANAAGFSIKESDVSKLYDYANKELANVDFNEGFYEADFVIQGNYSEITQLVMDIGAQQKLWGQQNDEPVIIVENITIPKSQIQMIGSKKDTVKFVFNGMTYMIFKAQDIIDQIAETPGDTLNITCAGRANINTWGGRTVPQIYIDEIELKESCIYDF